MGPSHDVYDPDPGACQGCSCDRASRRYPYANTSRWSRIRPPRVRCAGRSGSARVCTGAIPSAVPRPVSTRATTISRHLAWAMLLLSLLLMLSGAAALLLLSRASFEASRHLVTSGSGLAFTGAAVAFIRFLHRTTESFEFRTVHGHGYPLATFLARRDARVLPAARDWHLERYPVRGLQAAHPRGACCLIVRRSPQADVAPTANPPDRWREAPVAGWDPR